jgi:peptidyl-prolyl cis-trans isomerase C
VAWAAKWQRAPTSAELQDLVADKVREEVLYREALAMGLEQDDVIVKRRLAQKLEFLTEDVAAIRDPTAAELQAWYTANGAQFAMPGRVTFRHVYFSPDKRGTRAQAEAQAALARLADRASADPAPTGDAFFDRDYYADRTPDQVAALFGSAFSKSVVALPSRTWQGPIESGLGWHLVYIDAATAGHVPPFADADREGVKVAWIDAQRATAKARAYAAMRAKYEVVLPGAPNP